VYCNVSAQPLLERHTGGVLAFLILVCVTNVVLSMACLLVLLRNFVSRVCALTSILTWRVALWVYIFIFLDGQNILMLTLILYIFINFYFSQYIYSSTRFQFHWFLLILLINYGGKLPNNDYCSLFSVPYINVPLY